MKYPFWILVILFSFSTQGQELFEVPPGTIKINDTLFIDKGPVDNVMYEEFTGSVQNLWTYSLHDSLKKLKLKNIDDSLLSVSLSPVENEYIFSKVTEVEDLKISDDVSMYMYFNHPAYKFNPVVGISKEQAQLFCEWRTDMVNLRWSTVIDRDGYNKIKYRLPTEEEFKMAKEYFRERNKLSVIYEDSLLKINLEELRETDQFFLYKNSEFTGSGKNYKALSSLSDDERQSDSYYTFFRCICEVQK